VSPLYQTGAIGLADMVWGCFGQPGLDLDVRARLFDEVGAFDTGLQRLEDWDWLLRYARRHALGFLAAPLARIDASPGKEAARMEGMLAYLWTKHQRDLGARDRRHFAAGWICSAPPHTIIAAHVSVAGGPVEVVPPLANPTRRAVGRHSQPAGAPLRCAGSRAFGNWPGRATSLCNRAR